MAASQGRYKKYDSLQFGHLDLNFNLQTDGGNVISRWLERSSQHQPRKNQILKPCDCASTWFAKARRIAPGGIYDK